MIYPNNFETKIGFDRIRQLLSDDCLSELGRKKVAGIRFTDNFAAITKLTGQTAEFCSVLQSEADFPIDFYFDVTPYLKKLRIIGSYLELAELFDFKRSLEAIFSVYRFLKKLNEDEFPFLCDLIKDISLHPMLLEKIDMVMTKTGRIRDNASPGLKQIRSDLLSKQYAVTSRMSSLLKQAQQDGIVEKDTTLTLRNGRLVIPVTAAKKRAIKGFIHDESATGKTAFVEPAEIFETNNEIRELEYAEQREILKVLHEISEFIRPYLEDLLLAYNFLAIIDFIRAKARLAILLESVRPSIVEEPIIDWKNSRHPLLYLHFRKEKKKVVPLTIELNKDDRILLISGPNAGGKSVCLKTTGLLQYMFQCGLLVPMHESSQMGIFNSIFIDIGDEQSIDNDLSTYSSHLLSMKNFVKNADEKSLILIDEFGAGTEPLLGGAIAESILDELNQRESFGVITTHYTNLKHYASQSKGIINGAMLYDHNRMEPLFQLQIGKPGSSFAFEIARKIGLPEHLLKSAEEKVGTEQISFDKLLKEVTRDKRYWETKRKKIRQEEKSLDTLLEDLADENKRSKKERKKIIQEAKDEAGQLLASANKMIENTIRIIRENQADKEATRKARQELEDFKKEFDKEMADKEKSLGQKLDDFQKKEKAIRRKYPKQVDHEASEEARLRNIKNTITIGDKVVLKDSETAGEIVEMNDKDYIVAFGNLMTSIAKNKVEKISNNQYRELTRGQERSTVNLGWNLHNKRMNFKSTIDLRGLRTEEAMPKVYEYIDECITLNEREVKILHGTGSGILRQFIREYLRTVDLVTWFGDEHVEFGGAGITVVRFG
ncbi:MAG: Smr/MutS family protein [Bacteroidales bacterium]|nr:Smr/MutS family protein [Bacteroidales bacterium]MCF8457778.1 Smr/MutS family protein [Bacteroidales bacterium]